MSTDPPAAPRLFLALTLPSAASESLLGVQRALRGRHAAARAGAVRWIAARQFHLTLSFLGATPPAALPGVLACAERVCAAGAPLELEIAGRLVIFGEPQLAKAVVASVGQASPELHALHNALALALAGLDFKPEARAFTPHVTLARIKHQGDVARWVHGATAERVADSPRFVARHVVLYSSTLTERGGLYTELARFTLGRAR